MTESPSKNLLVYVASLVADDDGHGGISPDAPIRKALMGQANVDLLVIYTDQGETDRGDTIGLRPRFDEFGRQHDAVASVKPCILKTFLDFAQNVNDVKACIVSARQDYATSSLVLSGATQLTMQTLMGIIGSGLDPKIIYLGGAEPVAQELPSYKNLNPSGKVDILSRYLLKHRYFRAAHDRLTEHYIESELKPLLDLANLERLHESALGCQLDQAVMSTVLNAIGRGDGSAHLGVRALIGYLYNRLEGARPNALGPIGGAGQETSVGPSRDRAVKDRGDARVFRTHTHTLALWKGGVGSHRRLLDPIAFEHQAHLRDFLGHAKVIDPCDMVPSRKSPPLSHIGAQLPSGCTLFVYAVGERDSDPSPFVQAMESERLPGVGHHLIAVGTDTTIDLAQRVKDAHESQWASVTAVKIGAGKAQQSADEASKNITLAADGMAIDAVHIVLGSGTLEMNLGVVQAGIRISLTHAAELQVSGATISGANTILNTCSEPIATRLALDEVLLAMAKSALREGDVDLAIRMLSRGCEKHRSAATKLEHVRFIALQPADCQNVDRDTRDAMASTFRSLLGDAHWWSTARKFDNWNARMALPRAAFALQFIPSEPQVAVPLVHSLLDGSLGKSVYQTARNANPDLRNLNTARNKSPLTHGDEFGGRLTRATVNQEEVLDAVNAIRDDMYPENTIIQAIDNIIAEAETGKATMTSLHTWGGPWLLAETEQSVTSERSDDGSPEQTRESKHRYWLVIETGSNQAFVFSSNKRRVNVGASLIIKRSTTTWIDEWLKDPTRADHFEEVVKVSGKAIYLVDDEGPAKNLITHITDKALREAPGLEIWGTVVEVKDGDFAKANADAHKALNGLRYTARHPQSRRALATPFNQPCHFTGAPAVEVVTIAGKSRPVSAQIKACLEAAGADGKDWRDEFNGWPGIQTRLDEELNESWVGVIHADGNGMGKIFLGLGDEYEGSQFITMLKSFSAAIEEVTRAAVKSAATAVQSEVCAGHVAHQDDFPVGCQWWLPIVVGGDDVTALLRGDVALSFTEKLLQAFDEAAGNNSTIRQICEDFKTKISMSAGLVFAKPHHPFNQVYDLSEQLCSSAKELPDELRGRSAIDIHVLYDSVASPLSVLRTPISLAPDQFDTKPFEEAHSFENLKSLVGMLQPREDDEELVISSSQSHSIRKEILSGRISHLGKIDGQDVITSDGLVCKTDWIDALAIGDATRKASESDGD